MKYSLLLSAVLFASLLPATSQVNSGSNGSDGAFNPTQNVEIDMADHPDGIYHYTSVNIPAEVTVTFKPNAANTPVVWLVQGDCMIAGKVSLDGKDSGVGGAGGAGGYSGGNMGGAGVVAGDGNGPGGGKGSTTQNMGGNASFATVGEKSGNVWESQADPGDIYGNSYLLPLIGGSGGGGDTGDMGSGGGGAMLIAASGEINFIGVLSANGGSSSILRGGGGGSGGAIRLIASRLRGVGSVSTAPGNTRYFSSYQYININAGNGWIRFDAPIIELSGSVNGMVSRGFQPIILPPANQSVSLAIDSVGGVSVVASPTGQLITPDVIVPAAQQNPVAITVGCTNIPIGTEIIVDVKPANGPAIRAVGLNTVGTQASSTATVQVQMPRGGGTIQAKAVSGIQLAANDDPNAEHRSLAQTGWTADGEQFKAVEVTGGLGVSSQLAYITESGKRYIIGRP